MCYTVVTVNSGGMISPVLHLAEPSHSQLAPLLNFLNLFLNTSDQLSAIPWNVLGFPWWWRLHKAQRPTDRCQCWNGYLNDSLLKEQILVLIIPAVWGIEERWFSMSEKSTYFFTVENLFSFFFNLYFLFFFFYWLASESSLCGKKTSIWCWEHSQSDTICYL